MDYKRIIGLFLIGLSILFATFWREWAQVQLARTLSDYYFFSSDAGRYLVEFFFLVPLFFLFLTSNRSSRFLKGIVLFFAVRLVLAIVTYVATDPLNVSTTATVIELFYGLFLDIALLYLMIRFFNDMAYPFVARALLLLWAMMSLAAFAVTGEITQTLVALAIHTSFLIGMMLVANQIYDSQTN